MVGPPGSGKSMMAKRLPSILPPLTLSESLETTQIHSIAGKLGKNVSLISQRPFRSPHHTISQVALVGGGTSPQPGEISLAHNGVLFCDELPEFNKTTLEVLRQPLEDRHINISRAKYSTDYPCSFMFVASMNPCPCGYYGDPTHRCVCTPGQIQRYMNKISVRYSTASTSNAKSVLFLSRTYRRQHQVSQVPRSEKESSRQEKFKPKDSKIIKASIATPR